MQQSQFGKLPNAERLNRIKKSPNYENGAFQNQVNTPIFSDGVGYTKVLKEFFFEKNKNVKPEGIIPSKKTNLLNLDRNEDILVWFGHSSYFIQLDKKIFLIDPVFSGAASPVSFTTNAFKGTDVYTADDLPEIDILLISHDHWDHLDYETIKKLKPKIKKIICGLGVGEHFEYWGFDENNIIEKDWNEEIKLEEGFTISTTPARHFSGRTFKRNQSLWMSYVLQTPTMKIFIGGDGGYDQRFTEIGNKFDGFDLVILENGQYNKNWKYIHSTPAEVLQQAKELKTKRLFTVHNSKFALSNHPWNEPLVKITERNKIDGIPMITPMIGEQVNLKDDKQVFTNWWENVK